MTTKSLTDKELLLQMVSTEYTSKQWQENFPRDIGIIVFRVCSKVIIYIYCSMLVVFTWMKFNCRLHCCPSWMPRAPKWCWGARPYHPTKLPSLLITRLGVSTGLPTAWCLGPVTNDQRSCIVLVWLLLKNQFVSYGHVWLKYGAVAGKQRTESWRKHVLTNEDGC